MVLCRPIYESLSTKNQERCNKFIDNCEEIFDKCINRLFELIFTFTNGQDCHDNENIECNDKCCNLNNNNTMSND